LHKSCMPVVAKVALLFYNYNIGNKIMYKKTILVAAADSNIVELLKINFMQNGYKVIVAYNGDSAYKKIIEQSPGLVILDTLMPQINALISYLETKDEKEDKHIPLLVVIDDSEMKQLLNKIKVAAWINKLFDIAVLLKTVKQIYFNNGVNENL